MNYLDRFNAISERRSAELSDLFDRYTIVKENLAREAFNELGLKELGFHFSCVSDMDGAIVIWKYNETMATYEAILDNIKTHPLNAEGCDDNIVVEGTFKGYPIKAFVKD